MQNFIELSLRLHAWRLSFHAHRSSEVQHTPHWEGCSMFTLKRPAISALVFWSSLVCASAAYADNDARFYNGRDDDWYDGRGFFDSHGQQVRDASVQLGPRPFYLVDGMDEGTLKDRLKKCESGPFYRSRFSIGH